MNLGIVDVAVGKVDLAGIDTVCDHWSVIDNALGVRDADEGAIVPVADFARREGRGRKFRSLWSGYEVANRREVDSAFIEHDVSIRIQVASSCRGVDEIELCGKIQAEFLGDPLIGNVGQDVPGRLAGALDRSLVQRNGNRAGSGVDLTGIEQLHRSDQALVNGGRRRARSMKGVHSCRYWPGQGTSRSRVLRDRAVRLRDLVPS